MKKCLILVLFAMLITNFTVMVSAEEYTEKVEYIYTAEHIPSRVSIMMVPKGKENSFTENDVYAVALEVYHKLGEHTITMYPKETTKSGEYTLITMVDGIKKSIDISYITKEDKERKEALEALNNAKYNNMYSVITQYKKYMSNSFSTAVYDALHIDYQVKAMKEISENYSFNSINEFEVTFNEVVGKYKKLYDDTYNNTISYYVGGGPTGLSVPPANTEPVFDLSVYATPKNTEFNDIADVDWAKNAIYTLRDKNIISGVDENTYEPHRLVKRSEFCKMLVMSAEVFDKTAKTGFTDVDEKEWYYRYIASAKENGFVNGRTDDIFAPNDTVTRAEAAIMVYNVLKSRDCEFSEESKIDFDDISALDENVQDIIAKLADKGILSGNGEGNFFPNNGTSRAEAAVIISKMLAFM